MPSGSLAYGVCIHACIDKLDLGRLAEKGVEIYDTTSPVLVQRQRVGLSFPCMSTTEQHCHHPGAHCPW